MSRTRPPGEPGRSRAITLERLGQLLDAYGAVPERWPVAEREAADRLLDRSDAARALREEAADLDRLLDALPSEPPAAVLAERVLAAAPRRRPTRVWRRVLVAAVPLAAAAAVTLWLTIDRQPARLVADAGSLGIGEYASPTDVLLGPSPIDVSAAVPALGCADSVLGCPALGTTVEPYSQRFPLRRFHV
jgi:hypothetical protein